MLLQPRTSDLNVSAKDSTCNEAVNSPRLRRPRGGRVLLSPPTSNKRVMMPSHKKNMFLQGLAFHPHNAVNSGPGDRIGQIITIPIDYDADDCSEVTDCDAPFCKSEHPIDLQDWETSRRTSTISRWSTSTKEESGDQGRLPRSRRRASTKSLTLSLNQASLLSLSSMENNNNLAGETSKRRTLHRNRSFDVPAAMPRRQMSQRHLLADKT